MRVSATLILLSMAIPIGVMAQQNTDEVASPQDIGVTNTNETIYTWVDEDGVEHFVDSPTEAPPGIEVDEYDLDQTDRLSVGGDGLRESEKRYLTRQVEESIEEQKADDDPARPVVVAPSGGPTGPVVVDEGGVGRVAPIDGDDDRIPGLAGPGPDNIPDDPGLSTVVGNDNFVDDGFATDDTDLADDTLGDGTLTGTRDGDLDGGTLTGNQDVNIGDDAVGTDIDIDTGIATGDGSDVADGGDGGIDGDAGVDNATGGIGIGGGVAPADTGGTAGGTTGGASSGGAGTTAGGSLGTSAGGS